MATDDYDALKHEPFWLVWHEGGGPPIIQQPSLGRAEDEAHRLARKHPTSVFWVLAPVMGYTISEPPVATVRIDPDFRPF